MGADAPPETGATNSKVADEAPARRSPGAWSLLVTATVVGLAFDLWSKSFAFAHVAGTAVTVRRDEVRATDRLGELIPSHEPVTVIPQVLEWTLVLNPGAVFGMGAGQRWFFVAFTVGAIALCLWMFGWWTTARDRVAHSAFALVLAGGLGNLYDRLVFACVRDFIHPLPGVDLPFGLTWPGGEREVWPYVSNVADAYLIIGIAALVWVSFRPHKKDDPDPDAAAVASGG